MTDLGTIVLTHQPPLQRKGNLNGAWKQQTRSEQCLQFSLTTWIDQIGLPTEMTATCLAQTQTSRWRSDQACGKGAQLWLMTHQQATT
jgi:hypothetical protein